MAFMYQAENQRSKPEWGNSSHVIEVTNVTKRFGGETAVENVSFYVPEGSIFGFIGPSGSGKTTTIRILTGVYRPTEGETLVLGTPPSKFNQAKRARLGYMPQLFVLYPNLTVWENLNFAASLYGMSLSRKKTLKEILEFVELYEHRGKIARNISGGMQRRLSLASTLVHDPELIFLDEPTAGIDPVLRKKFWDHFKELQNQRRTLFITTQYVNEAAYCDLVGVMGMGRLITIDTPDGLRHRAYQGEMIDVTADRRLDYQMEREIQEIPGVIRMLERKSPNSVRLLVDQAPSVMPEIMEWAQAKGVDIKEIEEFIPPFDDVFVKLVEDQENRG
ncbi:MAG: ABC transporter ATP-binding protein [Chloroflexi bacterium]|nr:MAG: ABC transporter ATP-binding protein [Chloroflexota bacterium]